MSPTGSFSELKHAGGFGQYLHRLADTTCGWPSRPGTSLGGVETLASLPFNSSHFNMTDDERLEAGIMPGMVRLAIGIEGHDVLASDLRQALDAARN